MIAGEQDMGLAGMGACIDRQEDDGMGEDGIDHLAQGVGAAPGDQEQGGIGGVWGPCD